MGTAASCAFDGFARQYDAAWSNSPVGVHQRAAVWRTIRPLFRRGERILDLGCGTGVDAAFLAAAGVNVHGIDASLEMVKVARSKGVNAQHLAIEDLAKLTETYDGAISNFGVLNCVHDLAATAVCLHQRIRKGGRLAICVMGSLCLWETCHFLRSLEFRKATRRWFPRKVLTSVGIEVSYPCIRRISQAFQPHFSLLQWQGIGVCVPPSYISMSSEGMVSLLAHMDDRIAHLPVVRALGDHRLLVFRRI